MRTTFSRSSQWNAYAIHIFKSRLEKFALFYDVQLLLVREIVFGIPNKLLLSLPMLMSCRLAIVTILKLPHSTTVPNISLGLSVRYNCCLYSQFCSVFSNSEAFAKRDVHHKKRENSQQNFIDFCCKAIGKDVGKEERRSTFHIIGSLRMPLLLLFYILFAHFRAIRCNKIGNFQPIGNCNAIFFLFSIVIFPRSMWACKIACKRTLWSTSN